MSVKRISPRRGINFTAVSVKNGDPNRNSNINKSILTKKTEVVRRKKSRS